MPLQVLVIDDVGTAISNVTTNIIESRGTRPSDGGASWDIRRRVDVLKGVGQGKSVLDVTVSDVTGSTYGSNVILDLMSRND
jgi:hypothetical protein